MTDFKNIVAYIEELKNQKIDYSKMTPYIMNKFKLSKDQVKEILMEYRYFYEK